MALPPDPDGTALRNGSREGTAGSSGAAATAARSSASGATGSSSVSPARAPTLYIAHRDDDDDHPLAPGARRARASDSVRRAASAASVRSGSGGAAAGSPASPLSPGIGVDTPRGSIAPTTAANAAYAAPDADLLGIGPSRRRRDVSGSSAVGAGAGGNGGARDSPAARARTGSYAALAPLSALDSVSRADAPLLDARFDDMTDAELARFLVPYERGWDDLRAAAVPAETAGGSDADDSPLFPPSPRGSPPGDGAEREHPLRVLARAVRELRELVARLEDENAALRERERGVDRRGSTAADERERGSERQPTPVPVALANQRHAEQLSIHDSLVDALSTSLTSPARGALGLSSGPPAGRSGSTSPTPSAPQPTRAKSPAPSHASVRSARSARSARSVSTTAAMGAAAATADSSAADLVSPAARKAWGGMSIWGWKRPGRKGSTASLAPSFGAAGGVHEHGGGGGEGDGDDEEWRMGDGGSTPAFRAIFLATRIITPDFGSILLRDAGEVGDKVAALAHALVSNARDAGITPREPPGRARARSRGASVGSHGSGSGSGAAGGGSTAASAATPGDAHPGYGDTALAATVAVGRSLLKHGKAAIEGLGGEASPGGGTFTTPRPGAATHYHARPALLSLPSSRAFPTTAMAPALPSPGASPGTLSPSADTPPPSVELASIVPDESRPPTVLLSRQNLGSFFQSSRAKLTTATRFTSDQPPLTDRYGFIYDIQHASMLKDASRAGTPAPMSLTGHIPEPVHRSPPTSPAPSGAERREQHRAARRAAALPSSLHVPIMDHRRPSTPRRRSAGSSASSPSGTPESTTPPNGRSASDTPGSGRRRTGTMRSLAPAPARPIIAKDQLTVSVRGATGASTGAASSSTSPASATAVLDADGSGGGGDAQGGSKAHAAAAAASRLTVSSLLDQLTDIHDRQQKARTADWDKFLRKRTRGHRNSVGAHGREREQDVGVGGALAQIVAVGGTGKGAEEYRTFLRLVRRGIPMPYRADVWAECSGARDLLVPGEYAEILAVHKNDRSTVMAEIDKDVGRTFPGNVFFGGDGPGVAKLRRVLTAYSWHNPAVGYCQGMNMLAATLLLTYTDEEQAFWVLHCIIERLLPEDYYAPSLLGSRADQLVLADLVGTHLPRIAAHLAALGVDLTVLTFGWFLSLFTDCLPVETLFRVWDVLFVEGHDVIFRVAIAILKLNEAEICACESASDLFGAISGMTSRLWSADKLIALQHSFKQAIKRADVQALMDRHSAELVDD